MEKKVCFVSTYIGKLENREISKNFRKNDEFDYIFFTNLRKEDFGESSWEIITVDLGDFPDLNFVKISRYFKFMSFRYIREKLGRDYDFIFYCDCYLYPDSSVDWNKLVENTKNAELGLIQYIHPSKKCVRKELDGILMRKKETEENIKKTETYLSAISKRINICEKGLFFENTVIGFNIKSDEVIEFLNEFWKCYVDCPTYRDQPLWNFLLKKTGKKIYVREENQFRKYFLGEKKLERRVHHY